eukprot:gb/GECG01007982.1/.p1 GENE.gb/GECG01007982.1/~~gb/GECG01007982.1/.p1  ORF type:complete len:252 (+),score=51.08 gb/GECG01007982.1/:1-756(+)
MATLATHSGEEPKDVTQNEFKELKRVFDFLCDFSPKHKLTNELKPKLEVKSKILSYKQNPGAVKLVDENGDSLPEEHIEHELRRIESDCQEIQGKIDAIKNKTDKKIKPKDLQEALAFLGKKTHKREIEDMIWEVDENLDGCVDWEEFQLMFQRNIKDTTGKEPFQLFNVVQFMMYDVDFSGEVSVDETMHMLYARYGRERLESEMKALFGDKLNNGNGTLTFNDYLKAVSVRVPKDPRLQRQQQRKAATS